MSDGCKLILSPFTGCAKRKARNKTREKYMPVKRRQKIIDTTGDHITRKRMVRRIFRWSKCIFQW